MNEDREALRQLLIKQAFVESRPDRPLFDRSGHPVPWLYYGGEVCLGWRGLDLATSVLLGRLSTFASMQIATYGVSAIPLVAACVARGSGRYAGLVVRKETKKYGAARKIDGPIDRGRSVVFVDESISSGASAREAISALEAEGLKVEGVLCVVEFAGYGAAEWLRGRGYRVETVFDVWRDLLRRATLREPSPEPADALWAEERLPSGLSPAELARCVVATFSRTGLLPRPPLALDRKYDGRGGAFVSIRRRADDHRIVRAGIRREDPEGADVARDVVLAARKALFEAPYGALDDIAGLKFAVSLLGRPEPIAPSRIDHARHALVLRGLGPLDRIGFALPNSPHYDDELEQYRYARTVSAHFSQLEQHAIYRQRVERVVEPGATWPTYGAPRPSVEWFQSPDLTDAVAARACGFLREAFGESPKAEAMALPSPEEPIFAVGVSIYAGGLAACGIGWASDWDAALREAVAAALNDERYGARSRIARSDECTLVVSLLLRRRRLGVLTPERLKLLYRLGRDTLQASAAGKSGLVLAHFAVHQSLDARSYQDQVLRKAGLGGDVAQWTAYETAGWVVAGGRGRRLELGFPIRPFVGDGGEEAWPALAREIAGFVFGLRASDGLPAYLLSPWSGSRVAAGTATRVLIAVTGLLEAGPLLGEAALDRAEAMVALFVAGDRVRSPRANLVWDSGSDAQLLSCLCLLRRRDERRPMARQLIARLRALVREDGAIHAGVARMPADLDFLSGSILFALARAADWLPHTLDGLDLGRCLEFYRRRFRLSHPWGMVWWHGQAWSALADRDAAFAAFAFELADWAIERQSETTGAFMIHDLEPPRASFLTACVLEGLAGVWKCADRMGECDRASAYARAWRRGAGFVERLTMRGNDGFFSRDPNSAAGGVRATSASSELRIDYAGHALLALAKGWTASRRRSAGASI